MGKYSILFTSFSQIKRIFADPETGKLTPVRSLLASGTAGVIASIFAVVPSERIKTAMIEDAGTHGRFKSPLHAARILVREQGFRSIYAGFVATTMKQAATTCVRLGSYDMLKDLQAHYDLSQAGGMSFVNGAIAGTITVYTTQPIDVIKTRTQGVHSIGSIEAARNVMREVGIRGFWKGSTMRLGRNSLSGGILFTTYEYISALL
jgi:solute carrier family 25 citrate transporter 1